MSIIVAKNRKADVPKGEEGTEPISTGSIRIKPDLAYKLRIIVEADKTSAAEFLDPVIRQHIEMHFRRITQRLQKLADEQEEPK